MNKNGYCFVIGALMTYASCHSFKNPKDSDVKDNLSQHSVYDDSTLHQTQLPVLMPYNRIIEPAGKVVQYGDDNLENHTLDAKLIAGTTLLAVEDRYGVAIIDTKKKEVVTRWSYSSDHKYKGFMSTYSGIRVFNSSGEVQIFWSAANAESHSSYVLQAVWADGKLSIKNAIPFKPEGDSPLALPNGLAVTSEDGSPFLYVVLNGNNQLIKMDLKTQAVKWAVPTGVAPYAITMANGKAYISNWGGPLPVDTTLETAGVPYGKAYIDPKTGAISRGTVSVFDTQTGKAMAVIETGLHPNDIVASPDKQFVYVANGNSDNITVIDTRKDKVNETIPVNLFNNKQLIGDSPNGLILSLDGRDLYVSNGFDNAVAVIQLGVNAAVAGKGKSVIKGFIPTEAYPAGLEITGNTLYVTNLEGEGARVNSNGLKKGGDVPETKGGAYNAHHQMATLSIIGLPDNAQLADYTERVKKLSLMFREKLAAMLPRQHIAPRPVPERIGEPSVFKHVIYIIKENRTYDQVLGDMKEGDGRADLCLFGKEVTPNEHQLAKDFLLMDNYYVSGKSSAEGHQWTDAAMTTDYVEKSVRAWFRSYPHVQTDAMVYDKQGFIWNNAVDHGKSVRIYGEACIPKFKKGSTWTDIYDNYAAGKPFEFKNISTISRVRPLLSATYPGFDSHEINDQLRASAFIKELAGFERQPDDNLPQLMVMALPSDHTAGTRPGMPTPRAQVADNDLALGRIIEAVSKSRFWKNTVIFVTEDDSQSGWDHVSAYRTTGFVISPYSRLQQTVHTNYNQTCIVRTIEQILGIPPMNTIDATALPMFTCFTGKPSGFIYKALPNRVPINEMNPKLSMLKGKDLFYAKQSMRPEFDHIDGGNDDLMNKIIWHAGKGAKQYPAQLAGKDNDD